MLENIYFLVRFGYLLTWDLGNALLLMIITIARNVVKLDLRVEIRLYALLVH